MLRPPLTWVPPHTVHSPPLRDPWGTHTHSSITREIYLALDLANSICQASPPSRSGSPTHAQKLTHPPTPLTSKLCQSSPSLFLHSHAHKHTHTPCTHIHVHEHEHAPRARAHTHTTHPLHQTSNGGLCSKCRGVGLLSSMRSFENIGVWLTAAPAEQTRFLISRLALWT